MTPNAKFSTIVLILLGCVVSVPVSAQDDSSGMAVSDSDYIPGSAKALQADALKARNAAAKRDSEIRGRLRNTIWNDVDLAPGTPGQVWYLRTVTTKSGNSSHEWYYSNTSGLSLAGSWEVKAEQIELKATDGTLMGRCKLQDESLVGQFLDPVRKQPFGGFRLEEESGRRYRVLQFRVIDPNAGK